ncbi:unnamed protein product [Caenorhabditis bovis]|uniref:SXP/RAL-2 family protein Ani s 5-like cation-binding domain-containing protein n=1 Tax=Caenorhabditis bovis TaxID=2654633 RepID=A0A8S1F000_9PELO|nr:unnamed protein product [Caenorhabditis bovis]
MHLSALILIGCISATLATANTTELPSNPTREDYEGLMFQPAFFDFIKRAYAPVVVYGAHVFTELEELTKEADSLDEQTAIINAYVVNQYELLTKNLFN